MKKRIATIITSLLLCVTMLTGCNLFTVNNERYYNAPVVNLTYEDNSEINITKKELITAYANYGANLVSSYGYTVENAVKATMDTLINRKVVIKEAEKVCVLTNADKNKLWDDTLEALTNNLNEFEKEVLKESEIEKPVSPSEEESKFKTFTPYERKAEVVLEDGEYVIKVKASEQVEEELRNDYSTPEGKQALLDAYNEYKNSENTLKAAQSKYVKQLKKNEDGMNLSTDEASIFQREIDRIYTNIYENLLISKYEEYSRADKTVSSITVSQILERYKLKTLQDYTKYTVNPSAFDTDVLDTSKISTIDYIANDNYFFVSHILIKFNETAKAEYDSLEAARNNGSISPAVYANKVNELIASITATERDETGKVISTNKSVATVLSELELELSGARSDIEKAEAFNKFIYKYNEDDGIMNAAYNYVVGTKNSNMVESFTEASRKLNENGTIGSISEPVASEHGVHIIFYAGKLQNIFNITSANDFNLINEDILKLTNTRLNLGVDKTVFDSLYDELVSDNYSLYQNLNLNFLKENIKITYYKNNYEDLYK